MQENGNHYIWRCAKCSSHFTNIYQIKGILKQEKKCSKCKSINMLTLTDKEIFIHCKFFDSDANTYTHKTEESYSFPEEIGWQS